MSHNNIRRGFTLFELLLVLSAVLLLAAVAVPSIQNWLIRSEIDRTTGALRQVVAEARLRASETGEAYEIHYSAIPSAIVATPLNSVVETKTDQREVIQFPIDKRMTISVRNAPGTTLADRLVITSLGRVTSATIDIHRNGRLVATLETRRLTGELRDVTD